MFSYSGGNYGAGLSFVDYNQDGWDDITIAGEFGMKFFKNIGGTFESDPQIPAGAANIKSCSWVDFDNDGDQDIFLATQGGQYSLCENINGNFTDIFLFLWPSNY